MDPMSFRRKKPTREGDLLPTGMSLPKAGLKECLETMRNKPEKKPARGKNRGWG